MSEPFESPRAVAEHYAALLARHGDHPESVGWQNPYVPVACFFQMMAVDGLEPGCSVLDVGCGLGHFKKFLDAHDIDVDYTGWDVCEPLIAEARKLHPGCRFEVRDILTHPGDQTFDFVMCSGALTMKMVDHEAWVGDMIAAMFGRCRRALVFNLLSAYYAHDNPLSVDTERYYHGQPESVLAFCLELSRQVVLDHSELANSFAVYVYRSNSRPISRLARYMAPGKTFGPGHRAVAEYYRSFGMYDQLMTYLESLEPSADVSLQIAQTAYHTGDQPRRLAACRHAIELDPERWEPHLHLAIAHMEAGRYDDALPHLERIHALLPEDTRMTYRLAVCYERAGRPADALDAYRTVLADHPDHKGARAAVDRLAGS